jgi:septal ring factor EnvC (AmiA/AmiB activator)
MVKLANIVLSLIFFKLLSRITDFSICVCIANQEEHKKLEVFAFESETRIASLEEEITAALKEKEEVISINEALNSELEDLTEKLSTSASEIYDLKEEISALVSCFAKFFLGFSFQVSTQMSIDLIEWCKRTERKC